MTLVALVGSPDLVTGVSWLLVIFALVLVLLIVQALRERAAASGRNELLTALADAPRRPFEAFIDAVLAAPTLDRATVLEGAQLADYDAARLRAAFDGGPVVTLAEARIMAAPGEPLAALMETQEATHAVLLGEAPLRILAVNMPDLSSGPDTTRQLMLLHKLASAAETSP
jgi:hypothetical protein